MQENLSSVYFFHAPHTICIESTKHYMRRPLPIFHWLLSQNEQDSNARQQQGKAPVTSPLKSWVRDLQWEVYCLFLNLRFQPGDRYHEGTPHSPSHLGSDLFSNNFQAFQGQVLRGATLNHNLGLSKSANLILSHCGDPVPCHVVL